MKRDILIPLYPKYWEGILSGDKLWEIRKFCPKGQSHFKAYIYETKERGGCGLIVGEIEIDFVVEIHTPLDFLNEKTLLTMDELYSYAKGKELYGWHIASVKRYTLPLKLSDFKIKHPPQSYMYVA